ncbi:acetyl-CoA hydrolase/transferase C-terminal domain-containing protein [Cryptosporangium aurantiacum]|uniref:Acyl-CoA hydrolase n=1 Tax=Cryptosporangium aurantiacum TaxID=134849 RepID=A0A1M7PGQ4_9ACTN|nr:acetyl-CoA hydrolase/transferase C-terminal domain-containing protein [Cryptosporangium aurantiacum]SHN16248.1 Acyl-CoA hydrolase [Cryptosporangium aurantiacum]
MKGLADLIRPGARVAVGDGLGAPRSAYAALGAAARSAGGVRLVLGWVPVAEPELDLAAFADVRAVMSGWGLRRPIEAGLVRSLPVRLSAVPALLAGPLSPDVLVATVVPRSGGGYGFGTEVSWQWAAVDAGAIVAGVVADGLPSADAGPPLPSDRLVLVGESTLPPRTLRPTPPGPEHRAIAERVAGYLPPGARLQIGPGALGVAVLDALRTPMRIDSGLLPDAVVDLDKRGLLVGQPVATYLAGGSELLDWADGRPLLHRIEYTHDLGRLSSGEPFVAVNTALEVDAQGQVNVEALPGAAVGGIGGHPDYAVAATRSVGGLSIVALPRAHRGSSTLVSALSGPVSTPGHDVDVLITEDGAADLRGLDRSERAAAIQALWNF